MHVRSSSNLWLERAGNWCARPMPHYAMYSRSIEEHTAHRRRWHVCPFSVRFRFGRFVCLNHLVHGQIVMVMATATTTTVRLTTQQRAQVFAKIFDFFRYESPIRCLSPARPSHSLRLCIIYISVLAIIISVQSSKMIFHRMYVIFIQLVEYLFIWCTLHDMQVGAPTVNARNQKYPACFSVRPSADAAARRRRPLPCTIRCDVVPRFSCSHS